ncbi:MAG: NADH-quinone oxidoreductase subunit L [Planctomycetes bacterium]|nr:NADH-quinone oxidoreductase subunit L [Planctomycetota bacterium]
MPNDNWLWWIPALPLLGSALAGVLHFLTLRARRSAPDAKGPGALAWPLACAAVGLSFVLSLVAFNTLRGLEESARVLESAPWPWIDAGSMQVAVSMVVDPLSSVMLLVVTGVGFLIHVYAGGYMKGDPGYAKFFAYLNLFVAMMLMLVLSSSLLGLFIGWEGVGLCSYLLIGFWYSKGWPAEAGQKAFVVNRIGDACFVIGSFLLVRIFGTLDLSAIGAGVHEHLAAHSFELGLAALLLFGGACGKSAQLPLFVWLPDAMAGPTPVSALIHAATMVTSGVYLVVRLNPLFAAAPGVLLFIGVVAAATAFIAGSSAVAQRDLKGVLAYSTVSQLGYMFLGLSAGAWAAAIFHLVTHAFFKALLFLAAGSVIHGMHEEQDMHKMGGLRKHMPRTFVTFLAGAAALSGLPLLSGFFSKDEILALNFASGGAHYGLWAVGVVTAALTAFYTWRMVGLTFFGKERFDTHHVHPHEAPASMTVPLMVLAVLALGGGLLNLPAVAPFTLASQGLHHWLEPVTRLGDEILHHGHAPHLSHSVEYALLAIGAGIALIYAHKGFHAYKEGLARDEQFREQRPALQGLLADAWGIDRAYRDWVVQPVKVLALTIAVLVDKLVIDGIVNGAAALARSLGQRSKRLTDGSVASAGLWMGAAAALLAFFWLLGGAR